MRNLTIFNKFLVPSFLLLSCEWKPSLQEVEPPLSQKSSSAQQQTQASGSTGFAPTYLKKGTLKISANCFMDSKQGASVTDVTIKRRSGEGNTELPTQWQVSYFDINDQLIETKTIEAEIKGPGLKIEGQFMDREAPALATTCRISL
jgi:hypothetical protein